MQQFAATSPGNSSCNLPWFETKMAKAKSKRFFAACGVVIAIVMARRRRKRRNRTVWVRDWIKSRPAQGTYHQLLKELLISDRSSYRNFIRMDAATFNLLLSKVGPLITYQDTFMRKAIPPGERLALTLRFLATGTWRKRLFTWIIPQQWLHYGVYHILLQVKAILVFNTCIEYPLKLLERLSLKHVQPYQKCLQIS